MADSTECSDSQYQQVTCIDEDGKFFLDAFRRNSTLQEQKRSSMLMLYKHLKKACCATDTSDPRTQEGISKHAFFRCLIASTSKTFFALEELSFNETRREKTPIFVDASHLLIL